MKFDPTVNLGHMVTFLGFIVSGLVAFFSVKADLSMVSMRLDRVEVQTAKIGDAIVSGARTEARVDALASRIDRVERVERGAHP